MARGYSRIPEGVDIVSNAAIVIATIGVQCLTWNDHTTYGVRLWIWGVALVCFSQLLVAVKLSDNPDHERAIYCKVCNFILSFLLMVYGYALLDEVLKQNAPHLYGFVLVMVVLRMCYFIFYCCLVPSLYNCHWDESETSDAQPSNNFPQNTEQLNISLISGEELIAGRN